MRPMLAILAPLFAIALVLPLPLAAASHAPCPGVAAEPATAERDGRYVVVRQGGEDWGSIVWPNGVHIDEYRESNGFPGLQRAGQNCWTGDHAVWVPGDTPASHVFVPASRPIIFL